MIKPFSLSFVKKVIVDIYSISLFSDYTFDSFDKTSINIKINDILVERDGGVDICMLEDIVEWDKGLFVLHEILRWKRKRSETGIYKGKNGLSSLLKMHERRMRVSDVTNTAKN